MDIQKLFNDQVSQLIASGEVEAMFKKHILKCLESTISDVMGWGEFPKKLKAAVSEEVLKLDLSRLTAMDYTAVVTDIVKAELEGTMFGHMKKSISKNIAAYTTSLEKKEWKLSEIIHKFIKEIKEEKDGGDYGEISFHCEKCTYGDEYYIYFDEKSDKTKYECDYRIGTMRENEVFTFTAKGYSSNDRSGKVPSNGDRFFRDMDAFLFKLYTERAKVIVDEDNVETRWEKDYE